MNKAQYDDYARDTLICRGLEDWDVVWEKTATTLGRCFFDEKEIRLSEMWMHVADFKDVILHEIAHAMTPLDAVHNELPHGPTWKKNCQILGLIEAKAHYKPKADAPKGSVEIICIACNKVVRNMHRRNKRSIQNKYHTPCGVAGRLEFRNV